MQYPKSAMQRPGITLRHRVFTFVGLLVLLSVLGSAWTLRRVSGVSHALDGLRLGWIPLGKSLGQLANHAQSVQRELERTLGYSQWKGIAAFEESVENLTTSRFGVPSWLGDAVREEILRTRSHLQKLDSVELSSLRVELEAAIRGLEAGLETVEARSRELSSALAQGNLQTASEIYPRWNRELLAWVQGTQRMGSEWDRLSREAFQKTQDRMDFLGTGLRLTLLSSVLLSLLLLWFAERALAPLSRLSFLAREIKRRGLKREDKDLLAEFPIQRRDEVSDLAREFHSMAVALMERENVVRDQTERLEAQNRELRELGRLRERLREAESLAAIGRLSAQVAHEVRNPLHSIGLEAEMAIEHAQQSGDHALKQSLQSILESVERLAMITENYLKFSRTSSGKRTVFDLGEALESVLATYASACERQRVRVDWKRASGAVLRIHADREGVEQALGNLMRNALQALEDEGTASPRIEWTLGESESNRVWVKVRDNGPGISAEIQARLFSPFSTTKAQGTGLGLSWVKRIVDDHDGRIEVNPGSSMSSESWGGASFLLVFPAVHEEFRDDHRSPEIEA